jgi:cell division inhibitor SepF
LATLNSWAPTLVIVLALLLFGMIGLRLTGNRSLTFQRFPYAAREDPESLRIALRFAEVINAYDASAFGDPRVHLGKIVRLAPAKYQDGVLEIQEHFRKGRVVSVDLGAMSNRDAARVVDFCSGLLCGRGGWLFRATGTVVILTPNETSEA